MADAPEIDGAVYVASRRPLRVGEIATVKIERADAYDLHGTAVGYCKLCREKLIKPFRSGTARRLAALPNSINQEFGSCRPEARY